MGDRDAKDALFDAFAEVAKALGNGRRAEIVDVLAQGERSVEEIAAEIGQSVANTSHHLRALAAAGLVATRRDGTRIFYRLASDRVGELWAALRDVAAAHLARLDELADGLPRRPRRARADQPRRARPTASHDGDVVVLDVRPAAEYAAGHIAGARSVPIDRARPPARAACRRDVDVVAYCRGPYCVYADDAVRLLRRRGRRARRLEDGYPEWQRAGLPVETRGQATA